MARLVVTACGHTAAPGRLLFSTAPPPGGGGEGQWVLTPVTAGNTAGFFPQIALDESGLPHVVSLNYVGGAEVYEYATRGPAGWTSETISTAAQTCGGNTGVLSDIVVDDAGIPHVSLEIPDQAIQHGVRNDELLLAHQRARQAAFGDVIARAIAGELGERLDDLRPQLVTAAVIAAFTSTYEHRYRARSQSASRAQAVAVIDEAITFLRGGLDAIKAFPKPY